MKTMLKQILSIVVAASIMLLTLGIVADAANACIYYERIVGAAGEKICIPVGIKNNPGIMGFRITVKYPQGLSSPTVESGEVLKSGSINDSITANTSDHFDVVWIHTDDVTADGTLFTVTFDVSPEMQSGEYEIALSYSQKDTFNEKWQDVKLECENGKIVIAGEEPQKLTFIQKVVRFFKNIFDKIKGLFTK